MGVNLKKGEKISLKKSDGSGIENVLVGLGWQAAKRRGFFGLAKGFDIDIDASVIFLGENGKLYNGGRSKECLVYYGNQTDKSGAVHHCGDNLVGGSGEGGDDEQIIVNLGNLPADVSKLVFVVNIYHASSKGQHFGMVHNAFIRLADTDKGTEICRYNLSDGYDGMEGLIVGEAAREGSGWKFTAIGQPVRDASKVDAFLKRYW